MNTRFLIIPLQLCTLIAGVFGLLQLSNANAARLQGSYKIDEIVRAPPSFCREAKGSCYCGNGRDHTYTNICFDGDLSECLEHSIGVERQERFYCSYIKYYDKVFTFYPHSEIVDEVETVLDQILND